MNIEKAKEILDRIIEQISKHGEEYSGAYLEELREIQSYLIEDKKPLWKPRRAFYYEVNK